MESFYSLWEKNNIKGTPRLFIHVPYNEEHILYWLPDDNTPFVVRDNTKDITKALEEIGKSLINCFSNNQKKVNTGV